MWIVPGTNVVFVHVPKTAGQAVRHAFGMELASGGTHRAVGPEAERFVNGDYVRFCVVRDPVERFVSSYRYAVQMFERQPSPSKRFLREKGLDRDINALIDHARDTGLNLTGLGTHFRRQVSFVRPARPQIVLRHENLERDLVIVRALAPDAWKGLTRRNASDDRPGGPANFELTERSRRFVRDLYKPDAVQFGY